MKINIIRKKIEPIINIQDKNPNFLNKKYSTNNSNSQIKEYYRIKKMYNKIINSMDKYFIKDKYKLSQELKNVGPFISKELNCNESKLNNYFNFDNNINIFYEIFFFKNHPNMTSITEEYIQKKKFRNTKKYNLLKAMNNSYVSLFQIITSTKDYIEIEDVFTKEKFKIIDPTLSTLKNIHQDIYLYCRIVTYKNISFLSSLLIVIKKDKEEIKKYLENNYNKKKSNLARCLELHEIAKK